ncbi:MAG: MFS transporter [Anaerolineales bacterium]|nr:MFS transporter [Anaerolineales bacterium]MBP6210519.1 MFS transporter [Anaerolineales bacterium]
MEATAAQLKKQPVLSGVLILFLVAMIFANIGGNMYGPLMPLYLRELKATVPQIGLFFTLSQIVPLLLQILGGWLSDSIGRLRAIAIGSVFGIFVFFPLILAQTWQWLLLGEALGAITRSLVGPSFDAFIAEHSTEENRAKVFGVTQAIFMIVSVIGPPLGGWLAGVYGFKGMLLAAAFFYILATIIRVGMAREAAKGGKMPAKELSFESLKKNLSSMFGLIFAGGLITWILITDGVRDTSFALSMNLMPVYLQDIGGMNMVQIGWMSSVFGLCMMLTTIPGGWLSDKTSERLVISIGMFLVGISLFMFIWTPSGLVWMYFAGWALAGAGVGLLTPAYQSLISKSVPQEIRGTAFGLFSTSLGIISLPAPWIGAQLWAGVGPRFPFMLTAIVVMLSIIPVLLKFHLPKQAEPAAL